MSFQLYTNMIYQVCEIEARLSKSTGNFGFSTQRATTLCGAAHRWCILPTKYAKSERTEGKSKERERLNSYCLKTGDFAEFL